MAPTRRTMLLAIGGTAALAGCLGDDDDPDDGMDDDGTDDTMDDGMDDDDTTDGGDDDEQPGDTVQVANHPDFGDILVGPDGRTLYMFDADEQDAGESTCSDDCADAWPPLTVEDEAVAGDDVAGELSTFEREDGSMQVAANGWPLYYFMNDEEPGDANGQGVNDIWWVLDPGGTPVREQAETATVQADEHMDHGDILVGPDGHTLYMFDVDEQGAGQSECADDCADAWPPLTVEDDVVAGDGVDAELTTFERDDGSTQVAANGWPLYYFMSDEEPGDANGQGVNDVWWVLAPDGTPMRGEDDEAATVQVREHMDHGDILVGPDELTLYMFDADDQGAGGSECTGDCAGAWPPLTVEAEPVAGEGVAAELTTFERDDGSTQVAGDGWPLYHFASDEEPGDANGQGVNDVWWVLAPDGTPIRDGGGDEEDSTDDTSNGGGGGGY